MSRSVISEPSWGVTAKIQIVQYFCVNLINQILVLANQGNLDKKFAKNEPFVWGLSPISQKIGIFGENFARKAGLKN